ncbi:MAG: deoxyribodipyrimidine photo-lyase [Luteolibacter sp.]
MVSISSGARNPAIVWFRRDFRISDHQALYSATLGQSSVIPLYITSTWRKEHFWTGSKRQQFLSDSLASLAKNLETLGGRLIVRQGSAPDVLRQFIRETGAKRLFYHQDPDPFGKKTERRIAAICEELQVEVHSYPDVSLHRPDEILNQSLQPYRVYTPYSKNWLSQEKPQPFPQSGPLHTPAGISSDPLPTLKTWNLPPITADIVPAGERAARERLRTALRDIIPNYDKTRDFPAESGTSRISQDLRFGLVSIRTVYAEIMKARQKTPPSQRGNFDKFIKELAWREFYFAILHHFPGVLDHEFNADWRGLPWDEPGKNFDAWKEGRTGFPIVDAGMRQLLATGFMHNRVRMIVAMFLTKDLHIDWKLGESWFMQHLLDGEIASNNGGWQWSAGTGADAAPYFRIQNPWTQTARYDPEGVYIKQWVPELAKVDPKLFTAPPKNGPLAPGYPLPCVDHQSERDRTLAIFKKHRQRL